MNPEEPESPILSTQYGWITPSEQILVELDVMEVNEDETQDTDSHQSTQQCSATTSDIHESDIDEEDDQLEEDEIQQEFYRLETRGDRVIQVQLHNIPSGLYQVALDPFLYLLLTESNEMNDDLRALVRYVESFRPHRDVISLQTMTYRHIYCYITKLFNLPRMDYYWLSPWYNICDKLNEIWIKFLLPVFQDSCSMPVFFGGSGYADISARYLDTLNDTDMLLMLYSIKFRDLKRNITLR